ncbi:hypothetical protein WJX84_007571 [Apatococcus fuscideae]|uniref:Uncharacterized protein n=1 Tax=Apatococcus fuscideae TaxID=2026836 RepID=A0AAW1TGC7_9CHLO
MASAASSGLACAPSRISQQSSDLSSKASLEPSCRVTMHPDPAAAKSSKSGASSAHASLPAAGDDRPPDDASNLPNSSDAGEAMEGRSSLSGMHLPHEQAAGDTATEAWDWMMWVLKDRIGLVEEDLQSLEAKFRLADLLPKYTSLMASVIAAANADRRAGEAANIQRERTSIAKDSHGLKAQKMQERRQQQQAKRFLLLSGDCLAAGLVITGASLAATGWYQGVGARLTAACHSIPHQPPGGFLWLLTARIQPALQLLELAICYAAVLGGWLLGMLLVAAVGWALLRSNGLHDYHKTPMLSMVLGLMLACGWVGWAVLKVGLEAGYEPQHEASD